MRASGRPNRANFRIGEESGMRAWIKAAIITAAAMTVTACAGYPTEPR